MRAAFGSHYRMNFINNDGFNAAQRFSGAGSQHQVKRFRCGDENIGRVATEFCPLLCGGVSCADPHRDRDLGRTELMTFFADPA